MPNGICAKAGITNEDTEKADNTSPEYDKEMVRKMKGKRADVILGAVLGVLSGSLTTGGASAAAGAVIGSIAPGPGTVVGAAIRGACSLVLGAGVGIMSGAEISVKMNS
jgi:hypothetical protein